MADNDKPVRATVKASQRQKFDWCRDVSVDDKLSRGAKHLALITAIDKFGSNGSFKATQKELAKICGASVAAVRREIRELADENYWTVEKLPGANRYTLFTHDDRLDLWCFEESAWEKHCHKWDAAKRDWEWRVKRWLEVEQKTWVGAEKQFVQAWLDAEKQFVQAWLDAEQFAWLTAEVDAKHAFEEPVYSAMCARGMDGDRAMQVAHNMWQGHQEGRLPLDMALQVIAAAPQEGFTPAAEVAIQVSDTSTQVLTDEYPGGHRRVPECSPASTQVLTPDALTSGDDDSNKYVKSVKDVDIHQDAPAARSLGLARCADAQETTPTLSPDVEARLAAAVDRQLAARRAAAGSCRLCNRDGIFLDAEGCPVVMIGDEAGEEYEVECQHSMRSNLAEIRCIESESEGYWQVALTGLAEIDSQFEHLMDCGYDD